MRLTREKYEGDLYRLKIRLFMRETSSHRSRAQNSECLLRTNEPLRVFYARSIVWRTVGRTTKSVERLLWQYTIVRYSKKRYLATLRQDMHIAHSASLDEAKRMCEIHFIQNNDDLGFDKHQM